MSRLPLETWEVELGSGDKYEVNKVCAVPGCDKASSEKHHLWRRSFGTTGDWVVVRGRISVPNLIGLCSDHHSELDRSLGGQGAFIVLDEKQMIFYWLTRSDWDKARSQGLNPYAVAPYFGRPLVPQPGPSEFPSAARSPQNGVEGGGRSAGEAPSYGSHIEPGHSCPTCKRRVPHPKKSTSPDTKMFGFRVPLDEVDEFERLYDATAEHLGLSETKFPRYKVVLLGFAELLAGPGGKA